MDLEKDRDQAALALKAEQGQVFQAEAANRIAEQRPVKDKAWQTLKHDQEIERRTLKEQHVREAGTLMRQHISERLALQERWREQHMKDQAAWIAAGLDRAGMAPVQARAVQEIRLRKAVERRPPAEAAQAHAARAKAEREQLRSLREGLSAQRQANQLRASTPAAQRTQPGEVPLNRQRHSAEHLTDQQERSRHRSAVEANAADQLRQKARSGAALSSAEKASASPDVKVEAGREEKNRPAIADRASHCRTAETARTGQNRRPLGAIVDTSPLTVGADAPNGTE